MGCIWDFTVLIPKVFGFDNFPETWFQLVIMDKATDTIIGDVGIHFIDNHQSEIGCTVRKNCHGKGFATETLLVVIDFLVNLLAKYRIVGSIYSQNTSSIKPLEHFGISKEAHFHKRLLANGNG